MENLTQPPARAARQPDIVHPLTQELFRYWRSLCADDGRPPRRSALDLRRMGRSLPWLGLIAPGGISGGPFWRLAGSGLRTLWGRDLTGEEALADWPDFERRTMLRLLGRLFGENRPFVARLTLKGGGEAPDLPVEILALPLRGDKDGGTQALLAMIPQASTRFLDPRPGRSAQLAFLRTLPPEPTFHEGAHTEAPAAPAGARGAHLRVIEGGRGG